jgi:hypothetical protein
MTTWEFCLLLFGTSTICSIALVTIMRRIKNIWINLMILAIVNIIHVEFWVQMKYWL